MTSSRPVCIEFESFITDSQHSPETHPRLVDVVARNVHIDLPVLLCEGYPSDGPSGAESVAVEHGLFLHHLAIHFPVYRL